MSSRFLSIVFVVTASSRCQPLFSLEMALARRVIIVFAVLLQSSSALVEFTNSKLYDEKDFSVQAVSIDGFCNPGCRMYVSLPDSSADVAKQIIVHDYMYDDKSLYDIATMKKKTDGQKGYFEIEMGNMNVRILNTNTKHATAPVAVWVVQKNAEMIGSSKVYDAAQLTIPADYLQAVTIMSAEPFTLQSETDGAMGLLATLSGFDAVANPPDACTSVLEQFNPRLSCNIQTRVHSPLITIFFNDVEFFWTKTSISADVGDGELDFSGISFTASPGYIGCSGNQMYRSSLYDATSTYNYTTFNRVFDVDLNGFLNTDAAHPVTITDNTNDKEYKWSVAVGGPSTKSLSLQRTNSLDISWTRNDKNPLESFLVRVSPFNEVDITTMAPTTPEATTTTEPIQTTADLTTTELFSTTVTTPSDDTTTTPVDTTTTEFILDRTTTVDVTTTEPDATSAMTLPASTSSEPVPDTTSTEPIPESTSTVPIPEPTTTEPAPVPTTTEPLLDDTTTIARTTSEPDQTTTVDLPEPTTTETVSTITEFSPERTTTLTDSTISEAVPVVTTTESSPDLTTTVAIPDPTTTESNLDSTTTTMFVQSTTPEPVTVTTTTETFPDRTTTVVLPDSTTEVIPDISTTVLLPDPTTSELVDVRTTTVLNPERTTTALVSDPTTPEPNPARTTTVVLPDPTTSDSDLTTTAVPRTTTVAVPDLTTSDSAHTTTHLLPDHTTTEPVPERTTTVLLPDPTTAPIVIQTTTKPAPDGTTTTPTSHDGTTPESSIDQTTVDSDPVQTTDPIPDPTKTFADATVPTKKPLITSTTKKSTNASTKQTTGHPKDIKTTTLRPLQIPTTTTALPTTSEAARYGSTIAAVLAASVLLL